LAAAARAGPNEKSARPNASAQEIATAQLRNAKPLIVYLLSRRLAGPEISRPNVQELGSFLDAFLHKI
jgi:hypothetical protein